MVIDKYLKQNKQANTKEKIPSSISKKKLNVKPFVFQKIDRRNFELRAYSDVDL